VVITAEAIYEDAAAVWPGIQSYGEAEAEQIQGHHSDKEEEATGVREVTLAESVVLDLLSDESDGESKQQTEGDVDIGRCRIGDPVLLLRVVLQPGKQ
jgi:hypothetical protein